MKKLIALLMLAGLLSCEKDYTNEKLCWDCYLKNNKSNETIWQQEYCGKTGDEMLKIMDANTNPGITYGICYNKKWQH